MLEICVAVNVVCIVYTVTKSFLDWDTFNTELKFWAVASVAANAAAIVFNSMAIATLK